MKRKKCTILYVLQALKRGSSKICPISQTTIAKMLKLRGIDCDRKTVGRDINCLIEFGYKITKIKGGGCYIEGNVFADKELSILIESVKILNLPTAANEYMKDKIMSLEKINKVDL